MSAKRRCLLIFLALAPWLACAQDSSVPSHWAYPLHDPLDVLPPPVLANLPVPADTGMQLPLACEHINLPLAGVPSQDTPVMSLQDAVTVAICHSPELRMNRAAVQSAAATLGQANAASLPTLGFTLSEVRQSQSKGLGGRSNIQATSRNVALNWRLFDFGQTEGRQQSQRSSLLAASATLDATVLKVLGELVQQYFAWQSADALRLLREQNIHLHKRMLGSVLNRFSKGQADQSDVLQARSAMARADYDLSVSVGEAEKARASLTALLGLPANSQYRVAPMTTDVILSAIPQPEQLANELDAWLDSVKSHHPAIAAAKAQVDAAYFNVHAIAGDSLPVVDFSWNGYENGRPNQSLSGTNSKETTATVMLRVPLFDGFLHTYKLRAAQAQLEQKQAELQAAESQALKEALFVHAGAKAALANVNAAQQMAVAATQAAQSIQRKFDRGAADLIQLNQALVSQAMVQSELATAWGRWQEVRLRLLLLGSPGLK